jgi:cell wall-associated NlpC family hydrolase
MKLSIFRLSQISSLLFFLLCGCQTMAAPTNQDMDWQNAIDRTLQSLNEEAQSNSNEDQRSWAEKVEEVLMHALTLSGLEYKYGGRSPETGFDCSGFVQYVFRQAAHIALPPTARSISEVGRAVSRDELQPGDLVFFNTVQSAISHVGIYMGNNRFIHAPRTGARIRIESINNSYWDTRYRGAKRMDVEARNAMR